jgi:hypothetical protein
MGLQILSRPPGGRPKPPTPRGDCWASAEAIFFAHISMKFSYFDLIPIPALSPS